MPPEPEAGNIVLSGYIDVPAERIDAVEAALGQHIKLTLQEAGCRYFDVSLNIEIEGRFQVNEIFENRAAFDAHQARGAASAWARITAGIERHYIIKEIV